MRVHSTSIVEDGAELGDVEIGPYCHVGAGVKLRDGVRLHSHVVIYGDTDIGERSVIHPFAVVGGAPQHLGYKDETTRLVIGVDNVIREHVTINRGTPCGGGVTTIGDNNYIMATAHIAHDCTIGDHTIFANNASIAGHTTVGDFVFLGGLSAIHQHCRIGPYAFVGGCAAVTADIIPYASVIGNHAHLAGLNVIGLKRRGFSREAITNLRAAYKLLFSDDGTFSTRLARVRSEFAASEEVKTVVDFIEAGKARPLMAPSSTSK